MINFDDLIENRKNIQDILNRFVGMQLNYNFIDKKKRKSKEIEVSNKLKSFYKHLNLLRNENLNYIQKYYPNYKTYKIKCFNNYVNILIFANVKKKLSNLIFHNYYIKKRHYLQ